MLDFILDGETADFDAVHAARTGNTTWTNPTTRSLPAQLPVEVEWAPALGDTISWLTTVSNAIEQVRQTQNKRAEDLFGPT